MQNANTVAPTTARVCADGLIEIGGFAFMPIAGGVDAYRLNPDGDLEYLDTLH
ncbi:MAG: hypothetical protein HYV27_23870 [Candidatus Hydrogenedentes bacterium]|nr:hypothetical protein [Candidatus Hydrogenedentota bacterium]